MITPTPAIRTRVFARACAGAGVRAGVAGAAARRTARALARYPKTDRSGPLRRYIDT